MNHFVRAVFAGFVATVLAGYTSFVPTAAEAATESATALKEATAACKAEAKDQKTSWLARRRYVNNCVARTVKRTPAEIAKIVVNDAVVGCKAEAKGKKIRWLSRRKFVNTCVTAVLKDYSVDISALRKELNMRGLRVYTPEETGCHQNEFC